MAERTRFTAFITLYALTKGIYETEVEGCFDISPSMVKGGGMFETYHKPNWHRTRQEAVSRAEEMRAAKLRSLERQIKKLKGVTFA